MSRPRRWQRGEAAMCSCGSAPLRGEVITGTARRPDVLPVVQCDGQEPHACSTAVLVDRRGRPRLDVVPVRLARSAVDLAEQACGASKTPTAKWIEQAIRLRHGSE